jgi:signal transduction histidine kinase
MDLTQDVAAISRVDAVRTILEVICRSTGLGFAAVARVTEERWIACAVRDEIAFGLAPGRELAITTTLCDEVRAGEEPIIINHVAEDARFCDHPTPKMYGFQSYISFPIHRRSGQFFGTLCAIGPKPARLDTPETLGMFRLFAELIGLHVDAHDRLLHSERALLDERHTAELREQFIAVLGHDLRTPLAAIDAAASVLQQSLRTRKAVEMAELIRRSAARMSELIGNVLDFARGRLGGGLPLTREPDPKLGSVLRHVVEEAQATHPGRTIESDFQLDRVVACNSGRIAQVLANLLANALAHGNPSTAVHTRARSDEDAFELSVSNQGPAIPQHVREKLFEPFYRVSHAPAEGGLGLGLYISSEIARAHRGTLSVTSVNGETSFTLRMPVAVERAPARHQ